MTAGVSISKSWTFVIVTSIDSSLAIEILGIERIKNDHIDAMCYFQFDFEGIASVLSKRISIDLIADYIYK